MVDAYIDIASSKTGSLRIEFNRLLEDCKSNKIDIVITKNISRFGRDTVEVLNAFNQLKAIGVRVIFEQEDLDTNNTDSDLMITIIESIAQVENEERSDNIRWGIKQRAAQGTSKLYARKCYGYEHDSNGHLVINEQQAVVVRKIYNWYLGGLSINGIIKELEKQNISSPKGKDRWNKHSLETMLSNEKYKGDVRLLNNKNTEVQYLATDNHPAIITKETFATVQKEKERRSNVVFDENGQKVRKSTKYSSRNK